MNDFQRAKVFKETRRICKEGGYTIGETSVSIEAELKLAIEKTCFVPASKPFVVQPDKSENTRFAVVNASTLEVARAMYKYTPNVTVLNFASGHHIGGGVVKGRTAQEEDLCRASGLYECLSRSKCAKFYELANADKPGMNSDNIIISPGVPVFRDAEDELVKDVMCVTIISCVAVNTKHGQYHEAMDQRCRRVLEAAQAIEAKYLVLGAFGCGVFKNDPNKVAGYFSAWLKKDFRDVFSEVVFAICGPEPNLKAFQFAFKKQCRNAAQLVLDESEESEDEPVQKDATYSDWEGEIFPNLA